MFGRVENGEQGCGSMDFREEKRIFSCFVERELGSKSWGHKFLILLTLKIKDKGKILTKKKKRCGSELF